MFLLLHVKLVKHTPIVVVLHLHDELMIILIKVLKVMSATSINEKRNFTFIQFFTFIFYKMIYQISILDYRAKVVDICAEVPFLRDM